MPRNKGEGKNVVTTNFSIGYIFLCVSPLQSLPLRLLPETPQLAPHVPVKSRMCMLLGPA